MSKKVDKRILKTRKHIKQAFVPLLQEKGLQAISVYDIVNNADISRGTFYLHYQDKYDLFEKYVDELLDELITTIQPSEQEKEYVIKGESDPKIRERYQKIFQHLQQHTYFYQAMFHYKGGLYFYDRFFKEIKSHFYQEIKELNILERYGQSNPDMLTYFITYAFIGLVNYWLTNHISESPEEMAEQLELLLCSKL